MAVTATREIWVGQTGSAKEGAVREYTGVYHVDVNSASDGPQIVLDGYGGPEIGETYEHGNDSDDEVECVSIDPRRVDGTRLMWEVVAKWKTNDTDGPNNPGLDNNGEKTDDPLEFRWEMDVGYSLQEEAVEKAIYLGGFRHAPPRRQVGVSTAVTNSVFCVYDPPLTRDRPIKIIRITRNQATWPSAIGPFVNTINANEWRLTMALQGYDEIFRKHTVKLQNLSGPWTRQNKIDFWKVTLEFHIDYKDWDDEVVDRGLHALYTPNYDPDGRGGIAQAGDVPPGMPAKRRLVDPMGVPISEPVLLNGAGQPLVGSRTFDPPPVYIKWQKYDETVFPPITGF